MIIRINLHPAKKPKTKSNPGAPWLLGGLVLAAIILGAFWIASQDVASAEKQVRADTRNYEHQIAEIKGRISDLTSIKQKIEDLNNRQLVLARLTSIRQGPQFVMNEFSHLLTNPRDVIARKEATEQGWLLAWEPENVIIESFKDSGNGQVELEGMARSMDDIQEFWTRMKTSPHLRDIRLVEIKDIKDPVTQETVQKFEFVLTANFNYQTKDGMELVEKLLTDGDMTEDAAAQPEAKE